MSLQITSLNSGSNGNCYYIGNDDEAVLIDAGISCRETEKRMARLGLDIKKVKSIFISHEHTDHIRGVEVLSRKHQIPVYITPATQRAGRLTLHQDLTHNFLPHEPICVGDLTVIPFPKSHDAADPYSYVVKNQEVCIGIMTDIGHVCEHVVRYFRACHAVYLEANYDVTMLETGHYPFYLKKRISSDRGHLSNDQAFELLSRHRAAYLSHIFLSHLSKENNHPQVAVEAFQKYSDAIHISVAPRYEESPLFCIDANGSGEVRIATPSMGLQMDLFEE